jgi:hypothetical protein
VDFAQKYLFKNSPSSDSLDILSQLSEESEDVSNEDCDSQYHGETSMGTLDQNDLSHQLSNSTKEVATEKKCEDMIFSCCDWERARNQPGDLENFSDSSSDCSQKQCKRKEKAQRKEQEHVFDIDSIMNPHGHAPNSTEKIVSTKRYFSQSKNNKRNDLKIQLTSSFKIQKSEASPAISRQNSEIFSKFVLVEATSGKNDNECLSPMGRNEASFDFNVK